MRTLKVAAVAFLSSCILVGCSALVGVQTALGQENGADPIEIPLRMEKGRLVVTVDAPNGESYEFGLALGMSFLGESFVAEVGAGVSALTLGGVPVETEQAQTVSDAYLGEEMGLSGLVGGLTLNKYDILIDVPNGRLLLGPVGRRVRWDGVSLTNPTNLVIFHEVLMRTEVQIGGKVFGGLLDFQTPGLEVNEPVRVAAGFEGESVDSFRMGYSGWDELPVRVTENPIFGGWDGDGNGFVIIGAEVARNCAIAISWAHAELRTCRQ